MGTTAGNPANYPSTITYSDDTTNDSAANRLTTYQNLADRTAYLKANATRTECYYVGNSSWQAQCTTFTDSANFVGSTVCCLTISNVPDGSVIVADGIFTTSYSGSTAMARLEILEGSTVTGDTFNSPVPTNAGTPMPNVVLQGRFVKTGTGSVTIRLAVKGAGVYSYTPWTIKALVIKQI